MGSEMCIRDRLNVTFFEIDIGLDPTFISYEYFFFQTAVLFLKRVLNRFLSNSANSTAFFRQNLSKKNSAERRINGQAHYQAKEN